jgi:hypothetical protein
MWRKRIFAIIVVSLLPAAPCYSQTAGGSFDAEPDGSITPKFSGAYLTRAESDPRQREIEIILSTALPDLEKAVSALDPHLMVINEIQNNRRDAILIRISREQKVRVQTFIGKTPQAGVIFSTEKGTLVAELTSNTAERVSGRVFTHGRFRTWRGSTVSLDLTFSTPVTVAPAGTSLPPGGGEPGNALNAFLAARNRGDWSTLKTALSRPAKRRFVQIKKEDDENRINTFATLDYWFPAKDPKITGGKLTGDTAVLDVESPIKSTARLTLVRLIMGASGWVFDDALFIGMVPLDK